MSSCRKQLEVKFEDQTCKKWCMSLMEDKFNSLISQGDPVVNKVFGSGSLFSPLLFKKFFDPSDAFPLWEFGSDILSSTTVQTGGRSSTVEWFGTEKEYVLKAELPGNLKKQISPQVVVEKGKVVEISGLWREQQRESDSSKEWKSGNWWEYGYVRRLELPEDADFRKIEANTKDDIFLEIKIPKINPNNNEARDVAATTKEPEHHVSTNTNTNTHIK